MKKYSRRIVVLVGALLLVSLGATAMLWMAGRIEQAAATRQHYRVVALHAADWLTSLIGAETGQRGFVFTGDEAYLEPYMAVRDRVSDQLEELRQMTTLDEARHHLDTIRPMMEAKMAELARGIQFSRSGDSTAAVALVASGGGKRLMDSIRGEIRDFLQLEDLARERADTRLQSSLRNLFFGIIAGSVCALLIVVLVANLLYRNNEQRLTNLALVAAKNQLNAQAKTAAQLAAIVTYSDDAIIGMDPHGVVTSWNTGAETIFGYTGAEMEGQPITRLVPSDRLHEEKGILAHVGRGVSVRHFDTVRLRKDGCAIDVSVTVSPIKDGAGEVVGASKVVRDITERTKAEAKIQASESRFRVMANSIHQLAWIARADGFIEWYNRRWLEYTGKTSAEMEGWGWQSVQDPVELPRVMTQWQAAIASGTAFAMEFQLRRADGAFRDFLTRGEPIRDADGRVVQWFGTNTDVTVMRQAEAEIRRLNEGLEQRVLERTGQLEEANKELESFSYSVSHDLRTPVRAIDGFSLAVLEDFGAQLPVEGRRYLQTIRRAAQQMGKLIDDLLAFAQVKQQDLNKRPINTGEMVSAILDELGAPWQDRRVAIRRGDLPTSSGDPALLKQVWTNLLSNALKYTRKRDQADIEIGCLKVNGADAFWVRDNGTGFDMRHADKLFTVFQRFHRAEDYEGTGVGLAIVQRIVNRHGGRVWAEAAVDHGATFFFTLEKEIQA